MRTLLIASLILCGSAPSSVLSSSSAISAEGEIIDRILAVVDGQLITLSDTHTALELGLIQVPSEGNRIAAALDRLIDRQLMINEVNRYAPPEPRATEVEAGVQQIAARFGEGRAFEAALSQAGTSREALGRYVRDSLRIARYVGERFAAVGPEERERLTADWLQTLRRRGRVVRVYLPV
jgi:hypothetical protein